MRKSEAYLIVLLLSIVVILNLLFISRLVITLLVIATLIYFLKIVKKQFSITYNSFKNYVSSFMDSF